jgi:hypothetical protein
MRRNSEIRTIMSTRSSFIAAANTLGVTLICVQKTQQKGNETHKNTEKHTQKNGALVTAPFCFQGMDTLAAPLFKVSAWQIDE